MSSRGDGPGAGPGAGVAALGAWAELLRVSALFTVPGDALAGAAASGLRLNRGTALAAGSSLCLYEAGMALNDYSDRHIDAVERPGRPLPSGRITPARALAASAALTAAGLGLAAAAGRRTLLTATAIAGTVWAYDLRLKHTPLGPAAMAAARGLDLLLGATATAESARTASTTGAATRVGPSRGGYVASSASGLVQDGGARARRAAANAVRGAAGWGGERRTAAAAAGVEPVSLPLPPLPPVPPDAARRMNPEVLRAAGLLSAHTFAVTTVSRRETLGASAAVPLAALGALGVIASTVGGALTNGGAIADGGPARTSQGPTAGARTAYAAATGVPAGRARTRVRASRPSPPPWLCAVPAAVYAATGGRPLAHALFNPSPPLLQRAVGGGIRATIPLQAAFAVRAGRPGAAAALLALLPGAVRLSRRVSPT